MKILHVSPSFYPATYFGGPIYSTYALCNVLAANRDVELRVLTTDSAGPHPGDRLEGIGHGPVERNNYQVYYCKRRLGVSFSPGLLAKLLPMIHWADVVHLTAVYSTPTIPTLLICKVLSKPVIWSPRGSLQRWQGSSRPRTKRLWETMCNWLCDKNRVTLHVTSASELASSRRIKRAAFAMIPNGVDFPAAAHKSQIEHPGVLRLLYLGRLDKIKGIENLLAAMEMCGPGVTLTICGDSSNGYTGTLKEMTDKLELSARVRFVGHITGEGRSRYLADCDVLVMPSFGESFGMSVAEALAHGVPVIASKGTPWSEVETVSCGLWVENDPASLAAAIKRIREMPMEEMGRRGREWMGREFSWDVVGTKMLNLYEGTVKAAA